MRRMQRGRVGEAQPRIVRVFCHRARVHGRHRVRAIELVRMRARAARSAAIPPHRAPMIRRSSAITESGPRRSSSASRNARRAGLRCGMRESTPREARRAHPRRAPLVRKCCAYSSARLSPAGYRRVRIAQQREPAHVVAASSDGAGEHAIRIERRRSRNRFRCGTTAPRSTTQARARSCRTRPAHERGCEPHRRALSGDRARAH